MGNSSWTELILRMAVKQGLEQTQAEEIGWMMTVKCLLHSRASVSVDLWLFLLRAVLLAN